jgi:hypothetical protein
LSFDLKRNGDGRAPRRLRAGTEQHQQHREQQQSARRVIWADGQRRRNWESWRSTARHHFPGGNGTGGANFVVGVMLSVGAFARLTTRACAAPGTARELPPYEHDAVHGPNAQIAVITPRKVRRAADSAGRCIGGKKLRGSNPIWGAIRILPCGGSVVLVADWSFRIASHSSQRRSPPVDDDTPQYWLW